MARRYRAGRSARKTIRSRNSSFRRPLQFESLEARQLLAITVDTTLDVVDVNDGMTSLREAIFVANTVSGADTIDFAPALTADGPVTILLEQGELEITDALTIDGPGAELLTIDAQEQSRIFNVTATTGDYWFDGLTLTRGKTSGDNASLNDTTNSGGAIRSRTDGWVYLVGMSIVGNSTTGDYAFGGGVFSLNVSITSSQISDNSTYGSNSPGGGVASPYYSVQDGNIAIVDSRVENNHVYGVGAFDGGGGIRARRRLTVERSIISGNSSASRGGGFYIAGSQAVATLSDTELIDNTSDRAGGGAYLSFGAEATVERSTISGNRAKWKGGGIAAINSSVTVHGSLVSTNSTSLIDHGSGGGIFAAVANIERSVIENNTTYGDSSYGGGVGVSVRMTISDSVIRGNQTFGGNATGGGLGSLFGSITLSRSLVTGNTTDGNGSKGGGLAAGNGLTVIDSTIVENRTKGDNSHGGGVFGLGTVSMSQVTISSNYTEGRFSYGAGAYLPSGRSSIARSTITNNHALGVDSKGGGVVGSSLDSSIVAGNTAAGGSPDIEAIATNQIVRSLIGDTNGSIAPEAPIGSPSFFGSIIGGPINGVIDPLLAPLASNGGPTLPSGSRMLTHALLPGSPAIDMGDPAAVAGLDGVPEFDQRGMPWSRVVGGRIDMGAVESQVNPLPGDYNFNGIVDTADYVVWRNTVGSPDDLRADGSGPTPGVPDGVVNSLDYTFWKSKFGNVLPPGAGSEEQGAAAGELRVAGTSEVEQASEPVAATVASGIDAGVASVAGQTDNRRDVARRLLGRSVSEQRDASASALLAWLASRGSGVAHDGESLCTPDDTKVVAVDDSPLAFDAVFALVGSTG